DHGHTTRPPGFRRKPLGRKSLRIVPDAHDGHYVRSRRLGSCFHGPRPHNGAHPTHVRSGNRGPESPAYSLRMPLMRPAKFTVTVSLILLILSTGRPLSAGDGLPHARPEEVGFDPSGLDRVGSLFHESVKEKQIAGAVVQVARHGKLAYCSAVGMQD